MADAYVMTDSLQRIPDRISVSFLPDSGKLSSKSLQKGLNYYQQGYVHDIKIAEAGNPVKVSAKCWPSMRKNQPPHKLMLDVGTDKISDAYCSCKAGVNGRCSHIVGLLKSLQGLKLHNFTHVPTEQSCTSMPQQWNKPRGSKIKPVRMTEVTVAKPTENRKRKPVLCQLDTNYRLPKIAAEDLLPLSSLTGTPLQSRISSSVPVVSTPIGDVQIGSMLSYQIKAMERTEVPNHLCGNTCVNLQPPVDLPDTYRALNTNTFCEDPVVLELETRDQTNTELWHTERAKRVTASNFGKVISRKKMPNESFLGSLFPKGEVKAVPLEYGRKHEKVAKERYLKKFADRHFHDCGLVVNNNFSFLGATPDGKLCDNGSSGIVEIKCPYSSRNLTIERACDSKDFFLEKTNTSDATGCYISLKKSHNYYAQVQGQLMITGCDFCEFIVYTQVDMHVERIQPDEPYMQSKPCCQNLQNFIEIMLYLILINNTLLRVPLVSPKIKYFALLIINGLVCRLKCYLWKMKKLSKTDILYTCTNTYKVHQSE